MTFRLQISDKEQVMQAFETVAWCECTIGYDVCMYMYKSSWKT